MRVGHLAVTRNEGKRKEWSTPFLYNKQIMHTKKLKFLLVFFITLVSGVTFTACSSDDDETNGLFQTKADKELEESLMNTKWVITRIVDQNENGQITYDSDEDEKWISETYFLSSEKPLKSYFGIEHLCLTTVDGKEHSNIWYVYDGVVCLDLVSGKILSYTNRELIISTYKQNILGDFYEEGSTWYFKRVDVDDEEEVVVNPKDLIGYWINYSNHDQEMTELGFKTDGTCNYTYTYEPDNDKIESEYEYAKGTYKIKGNKLTMTLQFDDEKEIWEYTIVFVSSSKLVLKDEDGEKITFESLYE